MSDLPPLSRNAVAEGLDGKGRAADMLTDWFDNTCRVVHDLALGASHSSDGPGQRNAVSDPTGNTATAPPDPLAGLEARWYAALNDLLAVSFDLLGGNTPRDAAQQARSLAAHIRARSVSQPVLRRLNAVRIELEHVIYECVPTDRETAEEELREKHYLTTQAECCQACESPAGPTSDGREVKITAGLCRPGCYQLERDRRNAGRWTDRASFCNDVKQDVARGLLDRQASPLWRTASLPVMHEPDRTA